MEYPFTERIKEKLRDERLTLGWLLGELKKSDRWFYGLKGIDTLRIDTVNEISGLLSFDFIIDYCNWRVTQSGQQELVINEPPVPTYKQPEEPAISVQITIKGKGRDFRNNFGNVLKVIQQEGSKSGFKIE
jgi:hypothetical protein